MMYKNELKSKLDDYLLNGLEKNNFLIYNISIEKDEDERYLFTLKFRIPIPIPFPLARIVIFKNKNEQFQRKDILFNIYILTALIGLVLLLTSDFVYASYHEFESDLMSLSILGISLNVFFLAIFPPIILRKYVNQLLVNYKKIV